MTPKNIFLILGVFFLIFWWIKKFKKIQFWKKNIKNLWKSKKLKNSPENSPKWPENIQNDPKRHILKKINFFKNVWKSRKKSKIYRKIHKYGQNDPKIIPKMFKLTPKMQILKKNQNYQKLLKIMKKIKNSPKNTNFFDFQTFLFSYIFSIFLILQLLSFSSKLDYKLHQYLKMTAKASSVDWSR